MSLQAASAWLEPCLAVRGGACVCVSQQLKSSLVLTCVTRSWMDLNKTLQLADAGRSTFHSKVVPRWWEAAAGAAAGIHARARSVPELIMVAVGNVG